MLITTVNPSNVKNQAQAVECRKDSGIIDEIPANHKDIDVVMAKRFCFSRTEQTPEFLANDRYFKHKKSRGKHINFY